MLNMFLISAFTTYQVLSLIILLSCKFKSRNMEREACAREATQSGMRDERTLSDSTKSA